MCQGWRKGFVLPRMTPSLAGMQRALFPELALGYRAFRVMGDRLGSTAMFATWDPGANRAHCFAHRHPAPAPNCQCGFHALYGTHSIEAYEGYVIGAVVGWGNAELHRDGWRCEWAQPIALYCPRWRRGRRRIKALARRYEVPLFSSREKLRAYAEGIARPPARHARPESPFDLVEIYRFGFPQRRIAELATAAILVGLAACLAAAAGGLGLWLMGAGKDALWVTLGATVAFPLLLGVGYLVSERLFTE